MAKLLNNKLKIISGKYKSRIITIPNKSDDTFKLALKVSSKSLEGNESYMQDLILRTVKESSFDETKRIEELLEFISSDNEKSVIQNGHILSMSNAASQIAMRVGATSLSGSRARTARHAGSARSNRSA